MYFIFLNGAQFLTLKIKKNQRPRNFLYTPSWSWGQPYSSLNSAKLSWKSEVTLMYVGWAVKIYEKTMTLFDTNKQKHKRKNENIWKYKIIRENWPIQIFNSTSNHIHCETIRVRLFYWTIMPGSAKSRRIPTHLLTLTYSPTALRPDGPTAERSQA